MNQRMRPICFQVHQQGPFTAPPPLLSALQGITRHELKGKLSNFCIWIQDIGHDEVPSV
jgi:hypothetical protein